MVRNGAAEGTRTPDPIITNDVLYQLSYSGIPLSSRPYYGPNSYSAPPLSDWFCKSFTSGPATYI